MKRIIYAAFALVLASVVITGCHKRRQPNIPTPPPETEIYEFNEFTDAGAYYYGEWPQLESPKLYDIFKVFLCTDNASVTENGISGKGVCLLLDMNVVINKDHTITPGDYGPARNDDQAGAFLKGGQDQDGNLTGSYIYFCGNDGKPVYKYITAGNVNITYATGNNPKYQIQAEVIADNQEYTFNYYGFFSYTDINPVTPGPGPDDPDDPDTGIKYDYHSDKWDHGRIEYYGQIYGNSDATGYSDWVIRIGEKNMDFDDRDHSTGAELQLEVITKDTDKDIVGTYNVLTKEFNENTIKAALTPGSALCGYIDEGDGNYYGNWYFPADASKVYIGATKGKVTISKSGNTYSISYDFEDEFEKGKYSGSYTGSLGYSDMSNAPATKAGRYFETPLELKKFNSRSIKQSVTPAPRSRAAVTARH